MNNTFWDGFEKQAGLMQAVGRAAGATTGMAQRAGTALSSGASGLGTALRNTAASTSEAATRTAIQAKQRLSSGYRAGQRKALGLSPGQHGEMRREAGHVPFAAKPGAASAAVQATRPGAAAAKPAAAAPGLAGRRSKLLRTGAATIGGAAVAGGALGYGLSQRQAPGQAPDQPGMQGWPP